MKTIHSIFVEGVADKRFIEQLIEHLFGDISESINTYTQHDYEFDTNFFSQNLNTFECLSFISDGKKILPPTKLKMLPYFK